MNLFKRTTGILRNSKKGILFFAALIAAANAHAVNDDVFNSAHASTSIENLLNTWANKLETASDQFRAVII